jgi:putative ABC transport system substrate-binding protein
MNTKFRAIIIGLVILCGLTGVWLWKQHKAQTPGIRVALLQYVEHPALNEARDAFEKHLREGLAGVGKQLNLHYENVQGDPVLMQNLLASINPSDYEVIVTFATPISQAVKKRFGASGTPLVYGVITDPVSAGLVDSMEKPGDNNTASSDQWPYREQMEMIHAFMGDKNRIGCLLNPGEANTQYAMKKVREAAADLKLQLIEQPLSSVNDVAQAVTALQGRVDAIYIPADNTAMSAAPAIIHQADDANIPVFAGDPGTFRAGAVAGIGVSYTDVGIETANIVLQIVNDKKPAGQIPVALCKKPEVLVNKEQATKFGLTIPEMVLTNLDAQASK